MKKNLIIISAILCFGMLITLMLLITAHMGKQYDTKFSSAAISNVAGSEASDFESEKETVADVENPIV
jgi:hypothetical protein